MLRLCYWCGVTLPSSAFSRDRAKASSYSSICLVCDREKSRLYYERTRERKLERYHARKQERVKPPRLCKTCGLETPSRRHTYCDVCRPVRRHMRERARDNGRVRPDHNARYGGGHQKARAAWARVIEEEPVTCARCGDWIGDEPWDLDHDDADSSRYLGPSHRRCNRATAGRRVVAVVSRVW